MKRLSKPDFKSLDLFDACVEEMVEATAKRLFLTNRHHIDTACASFDAASMTKEWCKLPQARHGHGDALVAGQLTKSQMKALYEENVVKSKGRPRDIYDEIYVAANGACPYCGEIGDVETLDHYLPKAYFPALSVLPLNLVPACNKCNKGTSGKFCTVSSEQPINPYLDDDHFFSERWIKATVIDESLIAVRFYADAPLHWKPIDRLRCAQHFIDYKIDERYSKQVPGEMSTIISQRKNTLRNFSEYVYKEHLSVVAEDENLLLNGWKRTLYLALSECEWFCKKDFAT